MTIKKKEEEFIILVQSIFSKSIAEFLCSTSKNLSRNNRNQIYLLLLMILDKDIFVNTFCMITFGTIISTLIKNLVNQPRPYNNNIYIKFHQKKKSSFSFPSQSFLTLYLLTHSFTQLSFILGCYFYSILFLLALTRVIRGLHYPRDFLASLCIANCIIFFSSNLISPIKVPT